MSVLSQSHMSYLRKLQGSMKQAAKEISREEVRNIKRTIDTPYPPASEPGTPPHERTERLKNSVSAVVEEANAVSFTIHFFATAPYAEHLEYGTPKMAPRPFLRPHKDRFAQRFMPKLQRKLAQQQLGKAA